jgi:hypothetical protein
MKSTKIFIPVLLVIVVVSFAVVEIRFAMAEQSGQSPATKPVYKPNGTEARIMGTITLDGKPPRRKVIDNAADFVCMKTRSRLLADDVIVKDGKLANVFIYVKGGSLESYSFETPSTGVVLEHKGCRYVPHVLGIQTRQALTIINRDQTTHDINVSNARNNPSWHFVRRPGDPPIVRKFDNPETFIPLKCNQHPWERAWVGVFSHPFFAISDSDGNYKIEGLPPGDYTVVAWHEKFGERTMALTIYPYQSPVIDFAFNSEQRW